MIFNNDDRVFCAETDIDLVAGDHRRRLEWGKGVGYLKKICSIGISCEEDNRKEFCELEEKLSEFEFKLRVVAKEDVSTEKIEKVEEMLTGLKKFLEIYQEIFGNKSPTSVCGNPIHPRFKERVKNDFNLNVKPCINKLNSIEKIGSVLVGIRIGLEYSTYESAEKANKAICEGYHYQGESKLHVGNPSIEGKIGIERQYEQMSWHKQAQLVEETLLEMSRLIVKQEDEPSRPCTPPPNKAAKKGPDESPSAHASEGSPNFQDSPLQFALSIGASPVGSPKESPVGSGRHSFLGKRAPDRST